MPEHPKSTIFDDLPEKPPAAVEEEPKPKEEDASALLERERKEKAHLQEKLERESKARSEERRKSKELEAKLKESQKAKEEEEEPEEEPEKPAPPDVEAVVSAKLYEQSLVRSIKSRVPYREEAEVVMATVEKLRAGGLASGDAEEDVEAALAFLDRGKKKTEGGVPTPLSVSAGSVVPKPKIAPSAVAMGAQFGHTKEDWDKYGEGDEIVITNR